MAVILAPVMAASLLISHAIELTLPPAHIVGLAYYQLGNQTIDIAIPASVPKYTALVITLYNAYHPPFQIQQEGNINIIGPGRTHIKAIIWSTYSHALHFKSNAFVKRVSYAGWQKSAVNKVCQKEFGKNSNDILSLYNSPVKINIPGVVPQPNYIIGLAFYQLGHETTTINVPSSIPNTTALIILLYGTAEGRDGKIIIAGPGRDHIKEIIWSSYNNALQFNVKVSTKRLPYSGHEKKDINKVAQDEFGKNVNDTMSMYTAPATIDIAGVIKPPAYIVALKYSSMGGRNVNMTVSDTLPNNTALLVSVYSPFQEVKVVYINVFGPGRDHIHTIVWGTYSNGLAFNLNVTTKRVAYPGLSGIDKVALEVFGKKPDVLYEKYTSPTNIILP